MTAKLPTRPPKKPFTRNHPNRNTVYLKPFKHVEMTKAEMQDMLRKAVENTK